MYVPVITLFVLGFISAKEEKVIPLSFIILAFAVSTDIYNIPNMQFLALPIRTAVITFIAGFIFGKLLFHSSTIIKNLSGALFSLERSEEKIFREFESEEKGEEKEIKKEERLIKKLRNLLNSAAEDIAKGKINSAKKKLDKVLSIINKLISVVKREIKLEKEEEIELSKEIKENLEEIQDEKMYGETLLANIDKQEINVEEQLEYINKSEILSLQKFIKDLENIKKIIEAIKYNLEKGKIYYALNYYHILKQYFNQLVYDYKYELSLFSKEIKLEKSLKKLMKKEARAVKKLWDKMKKLRKTKI